MIATASAILLVLGAFVVLIPAWVGVAGRDDFRLGAGSIRFRHGWLLHRLAGVPVGVYVGIAAGGDNGARSVHRRIIVRFGQRGHSPRA